MEKLIINTADIKSNIGALRKYAGVQLIGTVEHGGYGCGNRFLARAYVNAGVQMLASSDAYTVNLILNEFPQVSTLLMCPVIGREELACIIKRGAVATISNSEDAVRLNAAAEETGTQVKAHLLIRTHKDGCGISFSQAEGLAASLLNCHNIEVDGAYTHIGSRYRARGKAVAACKDVFDRTVAAINAAGIRTPLLHMAEAYTALRYPELAYNAVRTGDAVIGRMGEKDRWNLRPVGCVETDVIGFTVIPAEEDKSLKSPRERRYAVASLGCPQAAEAAADKALPFTDRQIVCFWGKKRMKAEGTCGSGLVLIDGAKTGIQAGDAVRFPVDPRMVTADCVRNYE